MRSQKTTLFIFLILLLAGAFIADLAIGSVAIPARDIVNILFSGQATRPEWRTILIDFRLPRAITAVLAGTALSVSGLQMQTIFRNPLAGPFVLGISAGASLGVAILVMGFTVAGASLSFGFLSNWTIVGAAWIGSGLILLLILLISARIRDIMTILILGIMFGSAASAVVSILQYFSNEAMLKIFIIWTMGSLGNVTYSQMQVLVPGILAGLLIAFFLSKILNALLLGENYAVSMGLNIKTARFLIFLSTSLLAGTITAFCGPIGFIGIAVPHLTRLFFKTSDHRILLPASMLLGSVILIFSDIVSQLPGYDATIPINSVTALLGIPVVIWIILKNRKFSSLG